MIITALKLTNFMNIASADLTFVKGINVLSGKNGQGKSAVLEAVAFCLTGRRRGDSWKDYIKSKEDKFEIDLTISHGGQTIQFLYTGEKAAQALTRLIKVSPADESYLNSECDSFLESLFDAEMLENVLFSMQDSPSIASMTAGERRAIFKKVFNTDFLESLEKIKDDIDHNTLEKVKIQSELNLLESKSYHFPEGRIQLVDPEDIALKCKERDSLKREKDEWISSSQEMLKLKAKLESEYTTLSSKFQEVEHSLMSQESYKGLIPVEIVEKKIETLNKELFQQERQKHLTKESIQALEKERKEYKLDEGVERSLTETYNAKLASLNLVKLQIATSEKGQCTHCGQVCSSEHLQRLYAERDVTLQDVNHASQKLQEYNEKKRKYLTLSNSIASFESTEKNIDRDISSTNASILESQRALEDYKKKRKEVEEEIESFTKMLSILAIQKKSKSEEISAIPAFDTLQLKDLEARIEFIEKQISELETLKQVNEEKTRIVEKIRDEKVRDQARKSELSVSFNSKDQEEKDLSYVKQVFEIHLPNYINQKACDVLQSYMNAFLSSTKEDFSVMLKQNKKGIEFLYKSSKDSDWLQAKLASGFESALLTLAFKCAVARAYKADLLILDEPDRAATETASSQLFQTIVEDLGGFNQIFIITHRNNSLEYLQENNAKIYRVHQGSFELYD